MAKDATGGTWANKVGFTEGQVVLEIGWDEDVDDGLREAVETVIGSALEEDQFDGVVDAVLLWWRDGDGDLIDDCVDALTFLAEKGFVVVLVPQVGHPEHVEAAEIQEAADTVGLKASSTAKAGEWIATKLVQGGHAKQR